jgi:hypothetical protein
MDIFTWLHQLLLLLHLAAFAIAFSTVMREDIALIKARGIDLDGLAQTAKTLTVALAALWITGLGLMALDIGLDPRALLSSPKAAAKLVVVWALTANGIALHLLAFPALRGAKGAERGATVPVILGAVSTASWLLASFIGASRLVAPSMTFSDYMALYGMLLTGAVVCALVFVRPRVARLLPDAR